MKHGLFLIFLVGGMVYGQRSQFEKAANLRLLNTRYLKIYFTGAQNQKLDGLAEKADQFMNEVETRWLVKLPDDLIKVTLLNMDAKGFNHTNGPSWLTSRYDKKRHHIYLGFPKNQDFEAAVLAELKHQLIHHLVNMALEKELPYFLEEGLAQYYGNEPTDDDHFLTIWAFQRSEGVAAFMLNDKNYQGNDFYYGALLSRHFVTWLWHNHPDAEIPMIQHILQGAPEDILWGTVPGLNPDEFPEQLAAFDRETAPAFSLIDVVMLGDTWRIIFGLLLIAWMWALVVRTALHARGEFTAVEAAPPQESLISQETLAKSAMPSAGPTRPLQPQALPDAMELPPMVTDFPPTLESLPPIDPHVPPLVANALPLPPDGDAIPAANTFDFLNFSDQLPKAEEIQDLDDTPEPNPPPVTQLPVEEPEFFEAFEDFEDNVTKADLPVANAPAPYDTEPMFEVDDADFDDVATPSHQDAYRSSPSMDADAFLVVDDEASDTTSPYDDGFSYKPDPPPSPQPKIQRGKDLNVGVAGHTESGEAVLDIDLTYDTMETGRIETPPDDISLDTAPAFSMEPVPLSDGETRPVGMETVPLSDGETRPVGMETVPLSDIPTRPVGMDTHPLGGNTVPLDGTMNLPEATALETRPMDPAPAPVFPDDEDNILDLDTTDERPAPIAPPPSAKKKPEAGLEDDLDSVFGSWGVD